MCTLKGRFDVRYHCSDGENPAPRVKVTAGAFLTLVRKVGYNSQYSFEGDEREEEHEILKRMRREEFIDAKRERRGMDLRVFKEEE